MVCLIFRFCFNELKNRNNPGLRRFVFFCMPALFFMTVLVSWPLSFDFFKWLNFAFLPLFASFIYVFYRETAYTAEKIRQYLTAVTYPEIVAYCSVYAICVLSAYY